MGFDLYSLWTSSPRDWTAQLRSRFFKSHHPSDVVVETTNVVTCMSTGRVGSKTLSELGRLTLGRASQHEPKPNLFTLGRAVYENGSESTMALAALKCCRSNMIADLSRRSGVYLETSPQVTFLAYVFRELYNNTKFIHVVRHPAEVIRSGMRRGWYDGHSYDQWRIVPQQKDTDLCWESMSLFEKNVWLWTRTNQWILEFTEKLSADQKLLIKSEELFGGHTDTVDSFFNMIGDKRPSDRAVETVLGKKLNNQKAGFFPGFSKWSADQQGILLRHAGDLMDRFGYQL